MKIDARLVVGALQAAAVLLLAGCGGPKGPARYDLSGQVTFRGASVPRGLILFVPDKAKGNDGPGTQARVINGAYKTPPGRGTIGGPYMATIVGYEAGRMRRGRKEDQAAGQTPVSRCPSEHRLA